MPKSVRSFDRITIPAPCDADWDAMIGNDQVRFCEHCNLHVTDLSSMTRPEAMRLVARSRGRLCVRYIQRANGDILTKEIPQQLYPISRRVSRIAAGAFSATLSLSSAAAQTRSDANPGTLRQTQTIALLNATPNEGASISGVVKDPNGAVVSRATVTLTNKKASTSYAFVTQDDGAYNFSLLDAGSYDLTVDAPGFSVTELQNLDLSAAANKTVDVDLLLPIVRAEVEVRTAVEVFVSVQGGVGVREPDDPLAKAAFKDDLRAVKELIPVTLDINAWDKFTNTSALAYAIENHNREMVSVLLSAGASINSAGKYGRTPLMYLGEGATPDLVHDLIRAGANVNAHDESGVTVLMSVAAASPFTVVKELIEAGARTDAKDDDGNTVLMRAAKNSDPQIIKLLVATGVDVEARNENGESALTGAARTGKGQNLKALIDAGGTFNLKEEQLNQVLMQAAQTDDPSVVKMLIDAGANANAKEDDGTTVLMRAAEDGKPGAIKILIDAGADVNAVDGDGWTALMRANDVENVRILLNAGADMTLKNKDGKTAL
ncbi:MAG TPA: ankyrin repeat domain-containing protein, partial [Pyrinomonadaceae bacterium]